MSVHHRPFTRPQSVPPSNYPVIRSTFHANHFTYLNPTISKFGPSVVWPSCHPVELVQMATQAVVKLTSMVRKPLAF